MSKLAYGPASWHLLASSGPQHCPAHFYTTNYASQHARPGYPTEDIRVRHHGTGYASNFRPGVYYSARLDAVDNPTMGKLLQDNYTTQTTTDFPRYVGSDGRDCLPGTAQPGTALPAPSGFAHNLPKTTPTARQCHHFVTTEYHSKYPQQPFGEDALTSSSHSHKEGTGFTHAHNIEPVTFRPHEVFAGTLPDHVTWRPTGSSIMKQTFRSPQYMTGAEPFRSVSERADSSGNGYVKGSKAFADVQPKPSEMVGFTQTDQLHATTLQRIRKADPAEASTITQPRPYTSLTQCSFRDCRGATPTETQRLGREEVGGKELSGFSENNQPSVPRRERGSAHFGTSYQWRFSDPNVRPSAGMVLSTAHPSVQPTSENGFSRGTQLQQFGPAPSTTEVLRGAHPYVTRSLLKRHPYYDDDKHREKTHPHQ